MTYRQKHSTGLKQTTPERCAASLAQARLLADAADALRTLVARPHSNTMWRLNG